MSKGSKKNWCVRIMSFLFSRIGTFLVAILYVVAGGFLFEYLEGGNEIKACNETQIKYMFKLVEGVDRFVSISMAGQNQTVLRAEIEKALKEFSKTMFTLNVEPDKNCSLIGTPGHLPKWSFASSIYFCATVVTTIGYGHIAPTTKWGRIVCIVYAVLGIPIMLIFLAQIGTTLAVGFKFIYLNLCCCKCFIKEIEYEQEVNQLSLENREGIGNSNGDAKMTNIDSILSSQLYEKDNKGFEMNPIGQLRPPTAMVKHDGNAMPPSRMDVDISQIPDADNMYPYDEQMDMVFITDINIPITVIVIIVVIYVIIGAELFRIWETDWDIVTGVYFAFITLSTVGFGDLVPGKDGFEEDATQIELIIGSIYTLVGVAMVSMCINLIQEEIEGKFKWIGNKLGCINQEEVEDDEEDDDEALQNGGKMDTQRTIVDFNNASNEKPWMSRQLTPMTGGAGRRGSNVAFGHDEKQGMPVVYSCQSNHSNQLNSMPWTQTDPNIFTTSYNQSSC